MEVSNLFTVVLSSCSVLGRSSPDKNFPGLRVLKQACLNSWLRKGLIASLRLKESSFVHMTNQGNRISQPGNKSFIVRKCLLLPMTK